MQQSAHTQPPKRRLKSKKEKIAKDEGPSEFTRSKLQKEYNPTLHIIPKNYSPYGEAEKSLRRENEKIRIEEENIIVKMAREQIRNGKKIVIDWSTKTNFRSTRFPGIKGDSRRRINSEAIESPELFTSTASVRKTTILSPQIIEKSNILKDLISKTIRTPQAQKLKSGRPRLSLKASMMTKNATYETNTPIRETYGHKLRIQTEETETLDQNIRHSYTGALSPGQQMRRREEQFFMENNDKIYKAINFEQSMGQPLQAQKSKKLQAEQIQKRIISKTQLTLLKSDLIKKFKQIRDNFLEESLQGKQAERPQSPIQIEEGED